MESSISFKTPISVCIVVKNAEHTILECLHSLRFFDEIILLDNGSTDSTLQIAEEFNKQYRNLRIFHSEFIGFGALKNLALSHARNDWIFSIDSDEVCEMDLLRAISAEDLDSHTIYSFSRKNLYGDTWIKACGWYPDFVKRLFHRNFAAFNENIVHESVGGKDCSEKRLRGHIKHYAYNSISQFIDKMQLYSTLYAQSHPHKKSSMSKAISHASFTFIKNYFFQGGGCLDIRGLS